MLTPSYNHSIIKKILDKIIKLREKKVKKEEEDKNMDKSNLFNESLLNWESASSVKSPKYKTKNNKINFEFKYPLKD
jgi:hypothetical protein